MFNRRRGYRFRERVVNRAAPVLFPRIAESVAGEVKDSAFEKSGAAETPNYLHVVDRGSDSTILSFSNAALLHAGQPTNMFESFFSQRDRRHNLVFLRDVHRSAFHYTPTGKRNGLAFHEELLNNTLKDLGSKHTIGIGDSGGAAAAIYFGVRCGFDKVIAFSPPYPLRHWIKPSALLRSVYDFRLLFRERSVYWEHILVSWLSLTLVYIPVSFYCGFGSIFDPIADYCAADRRPLLTVFYGERCRAEAALIAPLKDLPDVSMRPQPTASHFSMTPLARSGRLGATILEIVDGPTNASKTVGDAS